MKIKVRKDKKTGESFAEYYKIRIKAPFRYQMAQYVVANSEADITAIVDTNFAMEKLSAQDMEAFLDEAGITYKSWPIPDDPHRLMGIRTDILKKKKTKTMRLFVIELTKDQFNENLFKHFFRYFDFGLVFGKTQTLEKLYETLLIEQFDEILFDKEYFADSYYDSVLCTSIRTTLDIAPFVRNLRF